MRLPYPRWWLALLAPLNNRYTWRLRLRLLTALDPPYITRYPMGKTKRGKGKNGGGKRC